MIRYFVFHGAVFAVAHVATVVARSGGTVATGGTDGLEFPGLAQWAEQAWDASTMRALLYGGKGASSWVARGVRGLAIPDARCGII